MPIGWKCLGQLRILFCIISNPTDQIIGWRQEDGSGSSTSTSSDYDSEDSSSEDETEIIVQRPNLIKDIRHRIRLGLSLGICSTTN